MKTSLLNPVRLLVFSILCIPAGGPFQKVMGQTPQSTSFELVRRLGSSQFQEREEASDQLEKMGAEARDALIDGMNSPDPEIVRRCRILLPLIENLEMESLVKKLSSNSADPDQLKLPGWERFKEKIGSDAPSKKLFLEMFRAEVALIREIERRPEVGFDLIQGRCQTWLGARNFPNQRGVGVNPITEGEFGAILFCALHPKVKIPQQNLNFINSLFYNQAVRTMLTNSTEGTPIRKLIGKWLAYPTDVNALVQNLYLAKNLNLKEGGELAAQILKDISTKKIVANPYQKGTAICTLGKLGDKSQVKLLVAYFNDDSLIQVINNNQDRIQIQVNDVALAMAIHLTGQDSKGYGFAVNQGRITSFEIYGLGFSSQDKRDQAFSKWAKWAKENKMDSLIPGPKPMQNEP